MKKLRKTILAVMLMGIMMVFAGCGSDFDAQGLMNSYMELITTGESESYCKLTNSTPEEATKTYQEMISEIEASFNDVDGMEDETKKAITDAFVQLLSKSKYEVHEATKVDDGYQLTMDIMPIQGAFAGLDDDTIAKVLDEQFASKSDVTESDVYNFLFKHMAELMVSNLDNITYGDAQTLDIKIVEKDGVYVIENEDDVFEKIGVTLIDYSSLQ